MAVAKVHLFSHALGMQTTCTVILPQQREPLPIKKLSVLWLLHGYSGGGNEWHRQSNIERYAAPYSLAVVMPYGFNSAYTDMAHGQKYFTYITEELPAKLQAMFPLSARREDNFIAGLSMGGAGSIRLGLSCPEKYAAIGCLSAGAINRGGVLLQSPLKERNFGAGPVDGTRHDPFFLARGILQDGRPCPRIFHACGCDDFLLQSAHETRDFFQGLEGNPFSYEYLEAPGAHTWEFWDEHIQDFLRYLDLPRHRGEYL
ncbi:MAG: hypothetical protein E7324_07925 [Clostridiales bacterium]|nr:hypothetical protein [Clostridiales bacterium]